MTHQHFQLSSGFCLLRTIRAPNSSDHAIHTLKCNTLQPIVTETADIV